MQRNLNLSLKHCAKNNQLSNVIMLIERGATSIVGAYAQACLNHAHECEQYLKRLIIKKGDGKCH